MATGSLTARQRAFVDAYLVSGNATQAALEAKYSEHTAQQLGSRLLCNVVVRAEIERRQAAAAAAADVTAEMIMREAWKIATEGKVEVARVSALTLLAKRHPDFSEKHHVSGPDGGPVIVERRTPSTR